MFGTEVMVQINLKRNCNVLLLRLDGSHDWEMRETFVNRDCEHHQDLTTYL